MKTEAIHKAPLLGGVGVGFGKTEDRRQKTEDNPTGSPLGRGRGWVSSGPKMKKQATSNQ